MNDLEEKSEIFSKWTEKNSFSFLSIEADPKDEYISEINYLNYRLPWSLLLYLETKKPDLVQDFAKILSIFLFKTISIGEKKINIANEVISRVINMFKDNKDKKEILSFIKEKTIDDSDFLKALNDKDFDGAQNIAKYILLKKEKSFQLSSDINYNKVNLEHIFPQSHDNLEMYSDKAAQIKIDNEEKDKFVNQLGNMTLLNYKINSSIKNSNFEEKKRNYKRFVTDANLYDTRLADEVFKETPENAWSIEHIQERNKNFVDFVKIIMEYPDFSDEN